MPRKAPPFDERYIPEPNSGCWLWLDGVGATGYGYLRHRGKMWRAHRVSWILHRGEIPKDMGVLHKCDTPSCVNPDHLYLGTQKENSADRERKGRGVYVRGENVGNAKLTEAQVLAIRSDTRSERALIEHYGVSSAHISRIKRRKTWNHI